MSFRKTLVRSASLLAALPLAMAASAAHAETRGYVIGWFATATHVEDLKEACPGGGNGGIVEMHIRDIARLPGYDIEKAKEEMRKNPNPTQLPRKFTDAVDNRAVVNGENKSIYNYPEATPDVNLETGVGKWAWGFDLGGKSTAAKFEDPDTHEKVDNQLWRALGCIGQFQAGPPQMPYGEDLAWNLAVDFAPAWLMQVSGEDLSKDGKVTITLDRATQHMERDAGASVLAGMTYVVEPTGRSHNVFQGEIKNGVITITPAHLYLQGEMPHYAEIDLDNAHMRLKQEANGNVVGYWGGYLDWKRYAYMFTARPATGDGVGFYHALKKMADVDPDPKTGLNRKISGTFRIEAMPAFIATSDGKVIASPTGVSPSGKIADAGAK